MPLLVALVLVALPNLLFLGSHLASPAVAAACVAGALGGLAFIARDLRPTLAGLRRRRFAACLATGFALCLLGGETHLFFANNDWLIRDAVLGDLVGQHWPVGYIYDGEPSLLRAPLGMYLVPAAVGKVLGTGAAHLALLVQNGMLLGCILYGFAAGARSGRDAAVTVAVFVGFSGWDVVGQALFGRSLAFPTHLPHWGGILQFSATVVQIFWAPNHAFSGWVFVAAYLGWRRGDLGAAPLAAVFALCLFWSPLSMIGAVPFLGYALLADARDRRLRFGSLVAPAVLALALAPVPLYLGLDFGRVPHGGEPLGPDFIALYLVFVILEVLPFVLLVTLGSSGRERAPRGEFVLVVAVLLLVPFFRIGGNDFVMRASGPALALLALRVARLVHLDRTKAAPAVAAAAVAVLAVGAVTPLYEIGRALVMPAFRISGCNMLTANRFPPNDGPMFHYLARVDAVTGVRAVLARPGSFLKRDDGVAACWPDDRAVP